MIFIVFTLRYFHLLIPKKILILHEELHDSVIAFIRESYMHVRMRLWLAHLLDERVNILKYRQNDHYKNIFSNCRRKS